MSEKINGTDLSNAELSLLCIALRCDVPYLDVASPLVKSGLLELLRDNVYRISEAGRTHLADVLGDPFIERFKLLHTFLAFWIDHLYVGRDQYYNYGAVISMVAHDLPKVAEIVNAEMRRVGRTLKEDRGKPWMTLKTLNDLRYGVSRKNEHLVEWRYGWEETENFSKGRERRYRGKKGK
jgi:hypothetical protein